MNQVKNKKRSLKKMTGIWKTETKDGEVYFKGTSSEGEKWVVMENKFKQSSSQPDYILYLECTDETEEIVPEIVENPQTLEAPDYPDLNDDYVNYDHICYLPLFQYGF